MDLITIDQNTIAKHIKDGDALAKGPTNVFKKLTDDKLDRLTTAYEKYSQAVNLLICNKEYNKALEVALKKIEVLRRTPEVTQYDISNEYISLAELQERIKIDDAISTYCMAINIFVSTGKMSDRKKYLLKVAKLYHQLNEKEKALQCYIEANDQLSPDIKIEIEIAKLNIELKKYDDALLHYEIVAYEYLKNKSLYSLSADLFFNATLCGICVHKIDFKERYLGYFTSSASFQGRIENKLLDGIFQALEESNQELFQNSITYYDSIKKLDNVQIDLLLYIKNNVLNATDELL